MGDPWDFGWTQLLGFLGLALTGVLGWRGLRTLDRWRLEKIDEKKLDLAIDALSLANKSKEVFRDIRGALVRHSEWDDMPKILGEEEKERDRRGQYYAILKRIQHHRSFFEQASAMQPRCAVLFGDDAETIFE